MLAEGDTDRAFGSYKARQSASVGSQNSLVSARHHGARQPVVLLGMLLLALVALYLAGCSSREQPTATPTPTKTATPAPPAQLPAPGATTVATAVTPLATPTQPVAQAVETPTVPPEEVPPPVGEPNRIVIPKIDLDAPIVDVGWKVVERGNERYTEWETADNAAGRHINSARPGERGNVVLSGHHNTKGEVFRRISDLELQIGDYIYLYDENGQRFTYQVTEVTDPPLLEVGASPEERLAHARYMQPTDDARVTLITCWPYWTNTHRVIVVGKLVGEPKSP